MSDLIMTVSDSPDWRSQEARMAKAIAQHERAAMIGKWANEGVVTVMEDCDPVNIRLRLENEFFAEPRDRFPSEAMIAKIQLALYAGRSEKNCIYADEGLANGHQADAMHYAATAGEWRNYRTFANALEHAYSNVSKITATVKPRRPRP